MKAISFQLYSARNFPPLEAVLPKLKAIGYEQVEGYAPSYEHPEAFGDQLSASGLAMPSGHFSLADLEMRPEWVRSVAASLGIGTIICPYLDASERPVDAEGWRQLAGRLNALARQWQDQGRDFSWHNHDFEFAGLPDGAIPMDILLEHAPLMTWQADLAWIVRGGSDPLCWIADHGERITSAHVKDIAPAGTNQGEDGWADAGFGVLDWTAYLHALTGAGTRLFVAEHDLPSDLERFASRSFGTLSSYFQGRKF
ncbi:sugar phosphate isomerase/epimerase [Roseibium denhamense]|uniref:Sugar phosphate isomerase/epimerase n=1 Tax=Roseibium denhamense TaxID=76305 RepID=A0ABY1NUF1_9HYPH|nr:sugar phosphate isomerase/epimerase [Roseibium denhamense]MTI05492.1 sugar phosphate isomerase/epimerase [Roseibium denhamense]SMP18185.1 Sugar phosphate isomerase/epimerase [Roseibium denhamense]